MTNRGVCLTEGLTLVTDNRKHFPMPDLALYPLPEGDVAVRENRSVPSRMDLQGP